MISENIRNRARHLMELREKKALTGRAFDLAMAGFLTDADAVARIEAAPIPQARRSCAAANVIDFLKPAFQRRGGGAT